MKREEFYTRVRDAAAAGRAYRVHTDTDLPESVGYVGGGDDLPARFAAEVQAVGGQAEVVADLAAAREALAAILDQYHPRHALCWQHPVLDALDLDGLLTARSIVRRDFRSLAEDVDACQAAMLAAEIGITSVSYAVAETGSLVMMARPGQERAASLLPPVHVAIVERRQILPDLFDVFARLDELRAGVGEASAKSAAADAPTTSSDAAGDLPSNVAFITGPSKTGDIELTLTTGVHGPGKWHIIVVR